MEYKKINPEEFKNIFLEVVEQNLDRLLLTWNNSKKYTHTMVSDKYSIFRQIACKLDLECITEYWTIDSIYYEKLHEKYYKPSAKFAQYINVALEHENNISTAHEEINKLSLFNIPLKVLITYIKDNLKIPDLLREFADIIERSDIFSDISLLKKQIVIIGDMREEKLYWHFYLYSNGKFDIF